MAKHSLRGSRWRTLRKRMLQAANYRCSWCNRPGRLEVDHIVPLSKGGARYDPSNLQVLCKPCHITKSGYVQGKHVEDRQEWSRFVNELR